VAKIKIHSYAFFLCVPTRRNYRNRQQLLLLLSFDGIWGCQRAEEIKSSPGSEWAHGLHPMRTTAQRLRTDGSKHKAEPHDAFREARFLCLQPRLPDTVTFCQGALQIRCGVRHTLATRAPSHPDSGPVLPSQTLGIQVMPKPSSSGWTLPLGYFMFCPNAQKTSLTCHHRCSLSPTTFALKQSQY